MAQRETKLEGEDVRILGYLKNHSSIDVVQDMRSFISEQYYRDRRDKHHEVANMKEGRLVRYHFMSSASSIRDLQSKK